MKKYCLLTLSALVVLFSHDEANPQSQAIDPAPAFTGDELKSLPRDGWMTNGGNVYNQRFSPLTQINRENVKDLKGVWRARLDGSGSEIGRAHV